MIVVDASAILELLLRRPIDRLADRVLASGETLHVPHLLDVEVAHALRRYATTREISVARGLEALEDLADLPLLRYPHTELLERMWDLRGSISAYDAAYVALAEALDAPLITTDGKLARSHGHHAHIEWLRA